MFLRVSAVALNAYREAVRARVLHALFGLALAVTAYSLVLGTLSLHQDARVVADVGTATASLFAVVLAITLGATSLHREVELKTIYPMLTRRLRRHEYILGKFAGLWLTVASFLVTDHALTLVLLGFKNDAPPQWLGLALGAPVVILAAGAAWRRSRTFALLPACAAFLLLGAFAAGPANGERQLVLASLALSLAETAVVLGITLLFAAFSSPFLTAAFSFALFVVGRSTDTLANLPERMFGESLRSLGMNAAKVLPNLQIFVPERPLLLGQLGGTWHYVGRSSALAVAYCLVLLVVSAAVFARRDFE